MPNVKCDYCNNEFEINLRTRIIERDIQLTYFVCPHCQHEYHSFYTNEKVRTRQNKINELWAKARSTPNVLKVEQIIRRIDELVQRNKQEMNRLRGRYEASN
jgi:transcription elongation factor Elf1